MIAIDLKVNVRFGRGAVAGLPDGLKALGVERPMLLTDQTLAACGVLDRVLAAFPGNHAPAVWDRVAENPTLAGVDAAVEACRAADADGVVALGGGSVLDTGKAVAVCLGHGKPASHFLGRPERIGPAVAPLVALPTTAGTGSEVSPGAGIHPDATSRGQAFRSPHCRPRLAVCDPELTATLPPLMTAATGLDALTHCVEGFLSANPNPPVEAIALDGVARVAANVERAVGDGDDLDAREAMMMAALEGGLAIGLGLGPAHAIANTLGDQGFNHGMLVTLAMPAVIRWQARHLPEPVARIGAALGLPDGQRGGAAVADAVANLSARTGLPAGLRAMGYRFDDLDEIVADATASFFNAGCPVKPGFDDYRAMIEAAM
jgi:4-hydroxybutyrate dehydrogenase